MALFGRGSRRPSGPDVGERATFLVDVRLLAADEGGRSGPVFRGYRPRLHIGQRLHDGGRIDWDCLWSFDGLLRPGEEARVAVRLHVLPDAVLQEAVLQEAVLQEGVLQEAVLQEAVAVEFHEGGRRVATGGIAEVLPGDTEHFRPLADSQVVVMRNAFDGVPVTSVFHERDGDWQFLTGRPEPGTAERRRLGQVLATEPALRELAGLPRGMWAHRDGPGEPWQVEEDPDVPVG
jgi:hypothetical protein